MIIYSSWKVPKILEYLLPILVAVSVPWMLEFDFYYDANSSPKIQLTDLPDLDKSIDKKETKDNDYLEQAINEVQQQTVKLNNIKYKLKKILDKAEEQAEKFNFSEIGHEQIMRYNKPEKGGERNGYFIDGERELKD
jgi:hypothetical protein